MSNNQSAARGGLTSTFAFRALLVLLVVALSLQFLIIVALVSHPGASESLRALLRRARTRRSANAPTRPTPAKSALRPPPPKPQVQPPPPEPPVQPHLSPRLPHLPPFAEIPDAASLAAETLAGRPTIAGVAAVLNKFLLELHMSNRRLASNKGLKRDTVFNEFVRLGSEHLLPFDAVYRGRPLFPIRDDDSVFISLASFRDHLLGDTLRELFGKAANPERLFVGAVVQNCFGVEFTCKTGAQVVGKDKNGRDMTKVSDAPPDRNGVAEFCGDDKFARYCDAGQVRALYVNETESLGPAMARYYASKLWGGETYFMQADSHLKFSPKWDALYIAEVKAARSFPKAVLSSYPPGFDNFGDGGSPGSRLCICEFSGSGVEDRIIRINSGAGYKGYPPRPTQIAFIAAGFFFARAEFLTDVPFDPFLPWCFMGEEIALSMRAWTGGWDIYAPRKNWIAHQYRPGRMGLPKFWGSVGRTFGRPGPGFSNQIQSKVIQRVRHMVGYPEDTREAIEAKGDGAVLTELGHYGLNTNRTREAYLELTKIDLDAKRCHNMPWCNRGEIE